jgi:hypothetical protein
MSAGPEALAGATPREQDVISHPSAARRRPVMQGHPARGAAVVACLSVLLVALGGCSSTVPKDVSATVDQSPHTMTRSAGPSMAATSPAGTSKAALAYLAAVDAATPAWRDLDATLTSHDGDVYRVDLLTQVNSDASFLAALRAITFPPEAAQAAEGLIAAVQAYDTFLQTGYDNFDYYIAHQADDDRLNETRSESSGRLRVTLGLPQSTSTFNRP